jgi:hypothetical protein
MGAFIDHLKERVEDTQKKMIQEDFENVKILPILKEAYELYAELDTKKEEAEKKVRKI